MTLAEYEAWRASQPPDPPEWALLVENPRFFRCPDKLTTAEDAFTALGHYLWRWSRPNPVAEHIALQLAAFIATNLGTLEALLADPEHLRILAFAQGGVDAQRRRIGKHLGGRPESLLSLLFLGDPLWSVLQELEPLPLLESCLRAQSHFSAVLFSEVVFTLPGKLVRHHGAALAQQARHTLAALVPPNVLDIFDAVTDDTRTFSFPELLPPESELVHLSPDTIRERLAHYRGMTAEAFNTLLVRRKFLADGEHVGEVIHRDAETLLRLGITRYQLAEALQKVSQQKNGFPWNRALEVKMVATRGHHYEPFHTDDVYYLSREVGGCSDVTVRNRATRERLAFGTMLPYLIRRACFFEGAVPYRLDPAVACRVLEPLLVG